MSPEAYNAWIERYREHYSSYMQQYQSMGLNNHADNYNYQQYWQQYMQYMQAYQSGMMMHMSHIPASPQPVTETQPVPEPAPAGGNGEAAGAGAAPMNAGGGGAMFENDEEDGRNRDWLDWLYLTSRLGVFLSIMYFYSTVGRLTLVFGFFVLILILGNRLYAPRVNNNDRNQRNNSGNTALHKCIYESRKEILQYLINCGSNLNFQSHNGYTPFHRAVDRCCIDSCKLLLEGGCNLELETWIKDGDFPICLARKKGTIAWLKSLTEEPRIPSLVSLQLRCREIIRQSVCKFDVIFRVESLQLPEKMKCYILLS